MHLVAVFPQHTPYERRQDTDADSHLLGGSQIHDFFAQSRTTPDVRWWFHMKKKMIVFTFLVLNRLLLHHNSYSRAKCEKLSTLAMVSELGAFTLTNWGNFCAQLCQLFGLKIHFGLFLPLVNWGVKEKEVRTGIWSLPKSSSRLE